MGVISTGFVTGIQRFLCATGAAAWASGIAIYYSSDLSSKVYEAAQRVFHRQPGKEIEGPPNPKPVRLESPGNRWLVKGNGQADRVVTLPSSYVCDGPPLVKAMGTNLVVSWAEAISNGEGVPNGSSETIPLDQYVQIFDSTSKPIEPPFAVGPPLRSGSDSGQVIGNQLGRDLAPIGGNRFGYIVPKAMVMGAPHNAQGLYGAVYTEKGTRLTEFSIPLPKGIEKWTHLIHPLNRDEFEVVCTNDRTGERFTTRKYTYKPLEQRVAAS